jgi:hypothetical protein
MEVANRIGAINVDWMQHYNEILRQLLDNRETIADNAKSVFDILGDFALGAAGKSVVILHTDNFSPVVDNTRQPIGGEIRVRFDIMRKDSSSPFTDGTMMIDRTYFKHWLASRGVDYNSYMAEMVEHGVDVTPKSNRGSLGKDTGVRAPQTYVTVFDLKHPQLSELLENASSPVLVTP